MILMPFHYANMPPRVVFIMVSKTYCLYTAVVNFQYFFALFYSINIVDNFKAIIGTGVNIIFGGSAIDDMVKVAVCESAKLFLNQ